MSKRKHQQQTRRLVRKALNASDDPSAVVKRGWSRDLHVSVEKDYANNNETRDGDRAGTG